MKLRFMDLIAPEFLAACIKNVEEGRWTRLIARAQLELEAHRTLTRLLADHDHE